MRAFLFKGSIYIIVALVLHFVAALYAGGNTDAFYLKFTNGTYHSMILGTSRESQGILPEILNKEMKDKATEFHNFSFTINQSPFGEVYLNAIRKKLDTLPTTKKNIFIIGVTPWSICTNNNPTDDPKKFREIGSQLDAVTSLASSEKPNIEYLVKFFSDAWGLLLFKPTAKGNLYLHEDGWLEVSVPMDSLSLKKRTDEKVNFYQFENLPYYRFSPTRYTYLEKTINYLKKYGEVYLVRLPVSKQILDIENRLLPNFNELVCKVTRKYAVSYWDFTEDYNEYLYVDGNHIYKKYGEKFTREISDMLQQEQPGACD